MIVYLETSALLRRLFGQPGSIDGWGQWEEVFTSGLTRVESLRSIDRLRLQNKMDDAEVAACAQGLEEILKRCAEISINRRILKRASQSFPTLVSTLDAFHLSSALLWKEKFEKEIIFLTHDLQLGNAARATGLTVTGI